VLKMQICVTRSAQL